jgi:hypothetical protein
MWDLSGDTYRVMVHILQKSRVSKIWCPDGGAIERRVDDAMS